MRKLIRVSLVLSLVVVGVLGTSSIALADPPDVIDSSYDQFLCPVVGDGNGKGLGVINADAQNGDNGVSAISPDVGTSLFPGHNQAGLKANENAYALGGPAAGAGPGHFPEFSPIWDKNGPGYD
jgi:hypothetical protein